MEYRVSFKVQPENDLAVLQSNVNQALDSNLPRLTDLSLGKESGPVAIVAGGPSLNDELENLRKFKGKIITCGSVHDFLIEQKIIPNYHVIYDPHKTVTKFLKKPHLDVIYLVTSQADPTIYNVLAKSKVYIWHALSLAGSSQINFRGEQEIPGGDGTVLRAWPLAGVLGFREIHFFGFDCSFPLDCPSRHAYDYDMENGETVTTTVEKSGRRFFTTLWMLNQLDYFVKSLLVCHKQFDVFIHGDSLVAEVCKG